MITKYGPMGFYHRETLVVLSEDAHLAQWACEFLVVIIEDSYGICKYRAGTSRSCPELFVHGWLYFVVSDRGIHHPY
jgi:hypothetical protein